MRGAYVKPPASLIRTADIAPWPLTPWTRAPFPGGPSECSTRRTHVVCAVLFPCRRHHHHHHRAATATTATTTTTTTWVVVKGDDDAS